MNCKKWFLNIIMEKLNMIFSAKKIKIMGSIGNIQLQPDQGRSTYLLTPWCRVLEKLTGLQLVKKFPTFHGT